MVTTEDVEEAKLRDRAKIGYPIDGTDPNDNFMVIVRNSDQQLPFNDEVVLEKEDEDTYFEFPFETTQELLWYAAAGIWICVITVEKAGHADVVFDRVGQSAILSNFLLKRNVKRLIKTKIEIKILQFRIGLAKRKASKQSISGAKRFKAISRQARLGRGLKFQQARAAKLKPKAVKSIKFIATNGALRRAIKPLIIASTVVDIILITARGVRGYRRSGIRGATAGTVAGIFDAATLSLAEGLGQGIESYIETGKSNYDYDFKRDSGLGQFITSTVSGEFWSPLGFAFKLGNDFL